MKPDSCVGTFSVPIILVAHFITQIVLIMAPAAPLIKPLIAPVATLTAHVAALRTPLNNRLELASGARQFPQLPGDGRGVVLLLGLCGLWGSVRCSLLHVGRATTAGR